MWEGEPGVVVGRGEILACSGLPVWRKNRQERRQLVSRGGVGVGPSIDFLAQLPSPPPSLAQDVLCVCVFAGGQHPALTPLSSPVGTMAHVVHFSALTTEAGTITGCRGP